MQTRDSRSTKLTPPEIVAMAIQNEAPSAEQASKHTVAAFAHMSKGAPLIDRIGNTVFVVHRGKGEQADRVEGRLYNVEPAAMLVKNMAKHLTNLQEQGIRKYKGILHNDKLLPIIKRAIVQARRDGLRVDAKAFPAKNRDGVYLLLVKLGAKAENK